jgi:2-polyprenyl-3-methyl-5-hydroxy-6-metoxy-1,4-benzoquinol methylase
VSSARWDLYGGPPERAVPTSIDRARGSAWYRGKMQKDALGTSGKKCLSGEDVVALFRDGTLDETLDPYLSFHAERIAYLCMILEPIVAEVNRVVGRPARLLDVGPGHLTITIAKLFGDRIDLDTLGFASVPFVDHAHMTGRHVDFDLNSAQHPEQWVSAGPYDIVIMAEVIEHVYTAPTLVLKFISTLMKPRGLLVIQTPNAVSLRKRVKLAIGRHPYEEIRETTQNPGHFREYTLSELRSVCFAAGFEIERATLTDYWSEVPIARAKQLAHTNPLGGYLYLVASKVAGSFAKVIPSFREGITITARRVGI